MNEQEISEMTDNQPGAVLPAVQAVMEQVRSIAKGDRGPKTQGGYKYRSADDVIDALGAAFREHGLFLQSRVVDTEHGTHLVEDEDRQGNPRKTLWARARVVVEYRVTSLVDGSVLVVTSTGEGLDQSDKASNKAMTAALKYALTQGFMIPTGDPDPDSEAPMVDTPASRALAERRAQEQAAQQPPAAAPALASAPQQEHPAEQPQAATEPHGADLARAELERSATQALVEAAKQWTQAQERGTKPTFNPQEMERANKAHAAAIKGDRYQVNRIIVAAKREGLMHAEISGTPLHGLLTTLRGVAAT